MWKEKTFEPKIKKSENYGDPNNVWGLVTKSAKELLLDFLNENNYRDFQILETDTVTYGVRYSGDTRCIQIIYYDKSVRNNRKI